MQRTANSYGQSQTTAQILLFGFRITYSLSELGTAWNAHVVKPWKKEFSRGSDFVRRSPARSSGVRSAKVFSNWYGRNVQGFDLWRKRYGIILDQLAYNIKQVWRWWHHTWISQPRMFFKKSSMRSSVSLDRMPWHTSSNAFRILAPYLSESAVTPTPDQSQIDSANIAAWQKQCCN